MCEDPPALQENKMFFWVRKSGSRSKVVCSADPKTKLLAVRSKAKEMMASFIFSSNMKAIL